MEHPVRMSYDGIDGSDSDGVELELTSVESQRSDDLALIQHDSSSTCSRADEKRSFSAKQRSQTNMAFMLSIATLCLIAVVTISVQVMHIISPNTNTNTANQLRNLDENNNANDDANEKNDYSTYACDDIFTVTETGSAEQCLYAQTCNSSTGLFLSFVFCLKFNLSLGAWCAALAPPLAVWLVILFRMLGSTAEDFFSPSLEMFSLKMGLPPRFAGVTLLALGNGAADVSATISAIVQNPEEGYEMSLGALTGAGMFVGTVVAGMVIVTADGVKCRGALVRDVIMLMVTVTVVFFFFEEGVMGHAAIRTFIILYFAFVGVVLAADVYHRKVVLPRIQRNNAEDAAADTADREADNNAVKGIPPPLSVIPESASGLHPHNDNTIGDVELTSPIEIASAEPMARQATPHPSMQPTTRQGRKKSTRGFGDRFMVAMSNYEKDEGKANLKRSISGWGSRWNITAQDVDRPVRLHGADGILNKNSKTEDDTETEQPESAYTVLLDEVDNICGVDTNHNNSQQNLRTVTFREQILKGISEFFGNFSDLIKDVFQNEENKGVDKFFLILELPFTILRKLTVPIPCEGYYCRTLVAVTVMMVPLWVASYALIERQTNLFYTGEGYPNFAISMAFCLVAGYMFMAFAPSDVNKLSMTVAVPIAFIGFLMAALWIDTIADQLVKLLTFLGVICGIPGNIMGLTVLAWGNSMGDLSANMTMANKGLANMAITACFAGPVFNILVGLGGGFFQLNRMSDVDETAVSLSLPNAVGFAFIMLNCLLVLIYGLLINKGNLSKVFGYAALGLYFTYVVTCVFLQMYVGDE